MALLRWILAAATSAAVACPVGAHGGGYRGPVPVTPGPGGPSTVTPGPASGGGLAVAAGTAGAGRSLDSWKVWWEFNKEPYLRVREATLTARARVPEAMVPESVIDQRVVPALANALRGTKQPDLSSACLVALAKIGRDHADFELLPRLAERLRVGDQEIRETAALALGITRRLDALPLLTALLRDDTAGRRLYGRERVDERSRAFAAYGLGLVAERSHDLALRQQVIVDLRQVLAKVDDNDRDLATALVLAMRLACPSFKERNLDAWVTVDGVAQSLFALAMRDLSAKEQLTQSHAMLAAAQVLGDDITGAAQRLRDPLLRALRGGSGRRDELGQSACLALGVPAIGDSAEVRAELVRATTKSKDRPTRAFAFLALASLGGDDACNHLMASLPRQPKGTLRPWVALSLGLFANHHRPPPEVNEGQSAAASSRDTRIGRLLHRELRSARNDELQAALAIALGLCQHHEAAADIQSMLDENRGRDELVGYAAIALALLGDETAVEPLRQLLPGARRRPRLMHQVASALGKLGDTSAGVELARGLSRGEINVAKLGALAGALGEVGDARCLESLLLVLEDGHSPDLARAFAAAALGGICDDDATPWNATLAAGLNYRAAPSSLSDGVAGVLDIL